MSEPREKYSRQDVSRIYRSYMMREGPQNVGTVQWPEPVPGALEGLKFLSTGVFETIYRNDLIELIKGSGGRYYSGFSKNLDYLLVGREAGPAKLKDAEINNIKTLNEEEFYHFVCEKLNFTPRVTEGEEDGQVADTEEITSSEKVKDEKVKVKKEKKEAKETKKEKREKKEKASKKESADKKVKMEKKDSAKIKKETTSKEANVTKSREKSKSSSSSSSAQSARSSRAAAKKESSSERVAVKLSSKKASSSSVSSKKASGSKSASESRVKVKRESRQ